jgi:hypothetical protein
VDANSYSALRARHPLRTRRALGLDPLNATAHITLKSLKEQRPAGGSDPMAQDSQAARDGKPGGSGWRAAVPVGSIGYDTNAVLLADLVELFVV